MPESRNGSLRRATVHGLVWKFLERFSSQCISLLVSMVLARLLTPSEFGTVAITLVFLTLADAFVTSGLGAPLIQRGRYDRVEFSTMFWAGLVLSLVLYAILFLVAPLVGLLYGDDVLTDILRVLGLRLPFSAMNSVQQAYVTQQMLFRKFFYATLAGTLASAVLGIALALSGLGVWALVAQNLAALLANMIVLHFIIPWRPEPLFDRSVFHLLFGYGWRFMATGVIGTLFDQLRSFIIGLCYSPADLAFFNRGESVPRMVAGNITASIESVMFAAFSHLHDDRDRLRRAVSQSMQLASYLVVPGLAILAGSATQVVELLLGGQWLPAVPYMQIVCLQQALSILGALNLKSIQAAGRADICLRLELYKKPFYFVIICFAATISPLAVVAGNAFYAFIALMFNAFPNRSLLGYGLLAQVRDIAGNFALGAFVFVIVLVAGDGVSGRGALFALVVEVIAGLFAYLLLSLLTRNSSFFHMQQTLARKIREKRRPQK